MSNQPLKEFITKWIEAYNNHDLDTITSFYNSNVVNTQLPYGKSTQGSAAMRNVYINLFNAFPDIHIEAENIFEQNDWVVVEWKFNDTMKGDFAGNPPQ